jgi:hypothetical protein
MDNVVSLFGIFGLTGVTAMSLIIPGLGAAMALLLIAGIVDGPQGGRLDNDKPKH